MSSSATKIDEHQLLNGLKLLQKESPPPGQAFTVVAYVLTNKIGPNGERGMLFIIGSYPSGKDAVDRAKEIIEKTGIAAVYALPTCKWEDIDSKYRPDRTIYAEPPKLNRELDHFWGKSIETREHEKPHIETPANPKESEKNSELDPDETLGTIEYYIRRWYLVIKNRKQLEHLKEKVKHCETMLAKRTNELQLANKANPEYETRWLSEVERKLKVTGELDLLAMLKTAQQSLIKEVLVETSE